LLVPKEWEAARSRDMRTFPLRSGRSRLLTNFTGILVRPSLSHIPELLLVI
jgi:hypothetical protein